MAYQVRTAAGSVTPEAMATAFARMFPGAQVVVCAVVPADQPLRSERRADTLRLKAAAPVEGEEPRGPGRPRSGKPEEVMRLLSRKRGATITDIQKATGWRRPSVRSFISSRIRAGANIEKTVKGDGHMVYKLKEGEPTPAPE